MGQSAPELQRVAVIGGGSAGIIAAKTLREVGHDVVVFEKSAHVGGIWKYDESADAPSSVLYKSLHTNLPTAIMQLRDLSFPDGVRSFPSHAEIHKYLETYADHFGVIPFIRLNSMVTKTEKIDGHWRLHVSSKDKGNYVEEFDRLLVANGHFSKPTFVSIKGIEHFPGRVTHSRSYRTPEAYVGKRVLLIGRGPSGQDISLELAAAGADEVFVATLDYDASQPKRDQRILKPAVDHVAEDGSIVFTDGSSIVAPDEIIHCVGYLYTVRDFLPEELLFPTSKVSAQVDGVSDKTIVALREAAAGNLAVTPLYKHVFAIEDSTVGFVGLPFSNLPFLCFELQVRWAARVFAGVVPLPTKDEMYADLFAHVEELDGEFKYLHRLGAKQKAYFTELASLSGFEVDEFIHEIYADAGFLRTNFPYDYRSAEYRRDAKSGKWVRRITPKGESEELVQEFSS